MYTNLLVEKNGQIAEITINRPKQLNALNKDTIAELHEALKAADEDAGVGVIILTGSGEKAFVAGADIKEFADFSIAQGGELAQNGQKILFRFHRELIDSCNCCCERLRSWRRLGVGNGFSHPCGIFKRSCWLARS